MCESTINRYHLSLFISDLIDFLPYAKDTTIVLFYMKWELYVEYEYDFYMI